MDPKSPRRGYFQSLSASVSLTFLFLISYFEKQEIISLQSVFYLSLTVTVVFRATKELVLQCLTSSTKASGDEPVWWADLVALVKDPTFCFCLVLPWWENPHQQSRIMSTIWWDSIGGRTATQLISIPHHPLVIYLLWQTHPYGTLGGELRIPRLLASVPILILYPKQELASWRLSSGQGARCYKVMPKEDL